MLGLLGLLGYPVVFVYFIEQKSLKTYMEFQHRSLLSSSTSSYLPITNISATLTNSIDETTIANSVKMANTTSNNPIVTVIKKNYFALCSCLIVYSIMAGYVAGIQPTNKFRYFSYHPLLMTCGMIGTMSISAITKKIGGYMNTKVRSFYSVHARTYDCFCATFS